MTALQFSRKAVWFYIVLVFWLAALYVWHRVDRSMARLALEAISAEEDAAASIGIDVKRTKLSVMLLSAVMTCIGGVLYAQYQLYVNPETVSGIGVSLQMVFGVIAGGMFVLLGPPSAPCSCCCCPKACACVGNDLHGVDTTIYGLLLVLFIIFMPKGILGGVSALGARRPPQVLAAADQPPGAVLVMRRTSISNSSSQTGGAQICQVSPWRSRPVVASRASTMDGCHERSRSARQLTLDQAQPSASQRACIVCRTYSALASSPLADRSPRATIRRERLVFGPFAAAGDHECWQGAGRCTGREVWVKARNPARPARRAPDRHCCGQPGCGRRERSPSARGPRRSRD